MGGDFDVIARFTAGRISQFRRIVNGWGIETEGPKCSLVSNWINYEFLEPEVGKSIDYEQLPKVSLVFRNYMDYDEFWPDKREFS